MKKEKNTDRISTFIGADASIDGAIESVNVAVVMGEVNGSIDAKERIEVYPPGRLGGDIQSPIVSIEPGGIFNGNCVMKPNTASAAKPTIFPKRQPEAAESKEKE
jgi:cytoskeletal protein CcmA (bactofilin family)